MRLSNLAAASSLSPSPAPFTRLRRFSKRRCLMSNAGTSVEPDREVVCSPTTDVGEVDQEPTELWGGRSEGIGILKAIWSHEKCGICC